MQYWEFWLLLLSNKNNKILFLKKNIYVQHVQYQPVVTREIATQTDPAELMLVSDRSPTEEIFGEFIIGSDFNFNPEGI